ncbi:MAG: ATP-dependent Clp protease ATP-binding subunit [Patescibacteria group bacterium]
MLTPDLLNRFTTHLKEALQKALSFAILNGREIIEPGDVLVGLLNEKGSIGAELLLKSGFSKEEAEQNFRGMACETRQLVTPDLSLPVKKIIEKCILTAHINEHKYVGTEHLLSALISSDDPLLQNFFAARAVTLPALREQILQVLKSTSRFPDFMGNGMEPDGPREEETLTPLTSRREPQRAARPSALDTFTRELTKPENADLLDPVIGRETELDRVVEILCRRNKNNPILLGDPGVGKTAIVEGLAKRLASGDVPDALYGKRIRCLDLALTVAGTMYRGEFEARLKQVVEEARQDPNMVLFIDEIHTIVGAGSTTGTLDAANILKPALARGEIRCIGATTWNEFKKHIEPDAALERRFQPITVDEPTAEATRVILGGLESRYADHHRVHYAPEALDAAVEFADRYITDRNFPDKAIDLIDEAAASVIAHRQSRESHERLAALEIAISATMEVKGAAVKEGHFEKADAATEDLARLEKERDALQRNVKRQFDANRPVVTREHVARVVARISNVPISTILSTERERLATLESDLGNTVIGQERAIAELSEIVRRSRLGLHDARRPKSAVLLVGPSGTGKTQLARTLAMTIFGREDALIKIDMSEFSEAHTVSKLVGSPAGYVGYREQTKLTDAIRKRPHGVVLFDEFEKAHADVQNILLQILEDGMMTDGTGRQISFRQSYIILTSNVGSDRLGKKTLGFSDDTDGFEQVVKQELAEILRPELMNRLDRTIIFRPLERDSLKEILRRELQEILARVEKTQRVACSAGDDVLEWLLTQPLPPEEGARAIRRLLEREVLSIIGRTLTEKPQKRKIAFSADKKRLKAT